MDHPGYNYRVDIGDGIALVDIFGSELHALDLSTGRVLWSRPRIGERARRHHVSEGVVYVSEIVSTGLDPYAPSRQTVVVVARRSRAGALGARRPCSLPYPSSCRE